MRKVKFNKWIPEVYDDMEDFPFAMEGTGCMETDYPNEGLFHQWITVFDASLDKYAVAVIELADGTIVEVSSGNVKFVNAE